jgi:hypothetical protein
LPLPLLTPTAVTPGFLLGLAFILAGMAAYNADRWSAK